MCARPPGSDLGVRRYQGTITIAGLYGYKRMSSDTNVVGKSPIEVTKNGLVDTTTLESEADWDGTERFRL